MAPAAHRALIVGHTLSERARRLAEEARDHLGRHGWAAVPEAEDDGGPFDVAIVFGGDGTLLRAAEIARGRGIAILGINVGHMGFLAEADGHDAPAALDRLAAGDYRVEQRLTLAGSLRAPDGTVAEGWALNEATLGKTLAHRMIEVEVSVDGRPLSTFGCDGVVVATPTGSTGHAFSGGGPVVWPDVEALLLVPLSAHALFARPLVVSPTTEIRIDILGASRSPGEVSFGGRRVLSLAEGGRLEVRRSDEPVGLVRFAGAPFADRLVSKFSLPVAGWRGGGRC
jgi:NAD+ kinase